MSYTESLITGQYPQETVADLLGLLKLSKADRFYLLQVLDSYGHRGRKGHDIGIAALGILSGLRKPEFDTKTGEHKPFIFETVEDADGSYGGFNYGLTNLSAVLNIDYDPFVASSATDEPEICAEHIDSDRVMVVSRISPTKNNLEDLNLREWPASLSAFTIMHSDGSPITQTDLL